MFVERYFSAPALICFDGETDAAAAAAAALAGAGAGAPIPDPAKNDIAFTPEQQEKINKIQAEEKRKHQAQYQKLEKQLQDTLSSAKLSQDERAKLEESLEDVRKQLRTKEEQAKYEKRQLEDQFGVKLAELERRAQAAETKYTESTIQRALQDAASSGDAFNPEIIVTVLRPYVKMVDEKPMIDFPDIETETGNPIVTQMTPAEAVKRMKQLPEKFGGLFKSNVVSGVGGSSATGGLAPGSGRVDPRKLTTEQYMKMRKENPEALGLKRRPA